MYINVSEQYKKAIKKRNIISTAYLKIIEDNILIPVSDISTVKLKDYCNDNGKIIGTAMSKELECVFYNNSNYDLQNKELEFRYGLRVDNTYEYIPYGNFIIKSFKNIESHNKYQFIAYDYMQKLNEDYVDNNTYPISMWNWYKNFCKFYGIECVDQYNELPNVDFIITQAPVFEGTSGRIALTKVAEVFGSFAKFNRENKLQMFLSTETDEKIEYSSLNTNLEINNIFNKINTVSLELGGGVEGENVVKSEFETIPKLDVNPKTGRLIQSNIPEGERILRIIDNPFLYSQAKREEAIDGIFARVKGFNFVPMSFQYIGKFYYDCGDIVKVQDKYGRYYTTVIMNQYLEIPATRKCAIDNVALTENELKYRYYSKTEQARKHTELIVDKQNQTIRGLITNVNDTSDKLSEQKQTIDTISSRLQATTNTANTALTQISEINQTVDNISLTVQETSGTVNDLKTDVSGKANKKTLVAELNLSIKDGESIVTISGNKVEIKSDNFELNSNGTITAKAGTIAGLKMSYEQGGSYLAKTYTMNNIQYQSGFFIPDNASGSHIFLYAGCPKSGYLSNSNLYIRHDGLIKAKWFEGNGESGYFKIEYDNGNTAMNLTKDGIDKYLSNGNHWSYQGIAYRNNNPSTEGIFFYDAQGVEFVDGLHGNTTRMLIGYKKGTNNGINENIVISDDLIVTGDLKVAGFIEKSGREVVTTNFPSSAVENSNSEAAKFAINYINGTVNSSTNKLSSVSFSNYAGDWIIISNDTTSDARLKENIKETEVKSALDIINKIEHYSFDFIDSKEHKHIGYIAQQLEKIDKDFVNINNVKMNDIEEVYTLNEKKITPYITKALQEIDKRVRKLEGKFNGK